MADGLGGGVPFPWARLPPAPPPSQESSWLWPAAPLKEKVSLAASRRDPEVPPRAVLPLKTPPLWQQPRWHPHWSLRAGPGVVSGGRWPARAEGWLGPVSIPSEGPTRQRRGGRGALSPRPDMWDRRGDDGPLQPHSSLGCSGLLQGQAHPRGCSDTRVHTRPRSCPLTPTHTGTRSHPH